MGTADNDIALIKIKANNSQGIQFNDFVQPACLPSGTTPETPGTQCLISGWGLTNRSLVISKESKKNAIRMCVSQRCQVLELENQRRYCNNWCRTRYPNFINHIPKRLRGSMVHLLNRTQCFESKQNYRYPFTDNQICARNLESYASPCFAD